MFPADNPYEDVELPYLAHIAGLVAHVNKRTRKDILLDVMEEIAEFCEDAISQSPTLVAVTKAMAEVEGQEVNKSIATRLAALMDTADGRDAPKVAAELRTVVDLVLSDASSLDDVLADILNG